MDEKNVILGTAGHIDHGKSSLVKAMTGVDPDRLKEEKERGITIDLGFADISYPDGLTVGIIDVPGHEKLIKNMLAGAGGIDMVLMVIAADEGIMPQSREHLSICKLLKIKTGIVAITKVDLVDDDWLALVMDEARGFVKGTFLENAEIIPVSAKNGMNVDVLKEKIREAAVGVSPKLIGGLFRLPIDRVFTLKGFGTVVTGTALSGSISMDSPVEILPAGITGKVRGLQSHGKSVTTAYAGRRTGINLQGIAREDLKRGDVVVTSDRLVSTKVIEASLELLDSAPTVKSRSRLHFYTGTAETIAVIVIYGREEIKAGEACYCRFRLEDPVVVLSGDRYIVRRFSPLETIGGGNILDPYPVKRKKNTSLDDLAVFDKGVLKEKIETNIRRSLLNGCTQAEIEGWIQDGLLEIRAAIGQLLKDGAIIRSEDLLLHQETFSVFRDGLLSSLAAFHKANPLKPGLSREDLKAGLGKHWRTGSDKVFSGLLAMISEIVPERETLRLNSFRVSLSGADQGLKQKVLAAIEAKGYQPPLKSELAAELQATDKDLTDMLKLMVKEGSLVRINETIYITSALYADMIGLLRVAYSVKPEMTVAEFRDILGTTRKYALPFLEYLDSHRVTLRLGDIRKFMLK
jgi:selenocysteine-specific elongation factor